MPTQLPNPITVTNNEGMSAQATHEQWGATVQPWQVHSPITAYLAVGTVSPEGIFKPLNGIRSDNGDSSPQYITVDAADFAKLTATTMWQNGLVAMVELCKYIESGYDAALKPAWYTV